MPIYSLFPQRLTAYSELQHNNQNSKEMFPVWLEVILFFSVVESLFRVTLKMFDWDQICIIILYEVSCMHS